MTESFKSLSDGCLCISAMTGKEQTKKLSGVQGIVCATRTNRYFASSVTTRFIANAQPEEGILAYQIIWSVAFPKINISKFGLEMPPPKGNAVAGSFAFRGDGKEG